MTRHLARVRKAIVASAGAIATAVASALTDDTITSGEWALVVVAVFTALGVYGIPNSPPPNPVERAIEGAL